MSLVSVCSVADVAAIVAACAFVGDLARISSSDTEVRSLMVQHVTREKMDSDKKVVAERCFKQLRGKTDVALLRLELINKTKKSLEATESKLQDAIFSDLC